MHRCLTSFREMAANPWTEITATTIQDSVRTGNITQIIQGYKPARVDFTIHGFGETPPVEDAGDVEQVTVWHKEVTFEGQTYRDY